ncbi:MAG TPA: undecaprenyldiphospho-muramoylpentapeptide beta-N-acetylglucosaminyltransferase [Beijerinckiaceae bacterium]|nr:undecaprenyldiphospho-muramoylpentapeptide beta-N-acetylglucosaminyltransferase [Beijerinckiaceae bacterium]
MTPRQGSVLLAAGGTGGHLFPAEALANALIARGVTVDLVSDERAARYADRFPAKLHQITSGTVTGGGWLGKLKGALLLLKGTQESLGLLSRLKPAAVVGFGGYPTVPPVYAATMRGIPTVIHEANAVMGRANRFVAPRVTRIATGFPLRSDAFAAKTVVTGNPVRPPVLEAAATPMPTLQAGGALNLLVFGGSQGARIMSDIVPPALEKLTAGERARIRLVQQVREEDLARVSETYARIGIDAEIAPFFKDLPSRIAAAQLVVSRSGASTVAELAVIGRPSILVPLPGSLDQDQAANARVLADCGGATLQLQAGFTPDWLADALRKALAEPERLSAMATAARSAGTPDAADRLADLVIRTAGL